MAIDLDFIYVRRLSPWASIESTRRILAFDTSYIAIIVDRF